MFQSECYGEEGGFNVARTHYPFRDEGEAPGFLLFDLFASLGGKQMTVSSYRECHFLFDIQINSLPRLIYLFSLIYLFILPPLELLVFKNHIVMLHCILIFIVGMGRREPINMSLCFIM